MPTMTRRVAGFLAAALVAGASLLPQVTLGASRDAAAGGLDTQLSPADEDVARVDSEAGELDALLSEADPHWYAGLWVDHQPALGVSVYSTVPNPVELGTAAAQFESLAGRVVVRPASVSLKELIAEQEQILSRFRAVCRSRSGSTFVRTA